MLNIKYAEVCVDMIVYGMTQTNMEVLMLGLLVVLGQQT